jgi:hypothetical protein
MAFLGFELNFPHYLYKRLSKMDKFYQRGFGNPKRSLFHYGLICMIVEFQLTQLGFSWEEFLCKYGFDQTQIPEVTDKSSSDPLFICEHYPQDQSEVNFSVIFHDSNLKPSPKSRKSSCHLKIRNL